MEVQVNSNTPQLGHLWRQLHANLGPTETQHGEHCFKRSVIDSKKTQKIQVKTGRFEDFGSGRLCPPFRSHMDLNLGRSCSQMGPSCSQVVPSWSQVGPKLEPIGPSWAEVGPCWPKLTPSRANVAAMLDRNGPFGQFRADLQNVQSTRRGPGQTWRPPPAEAVPV